MKFHTSFRFKFLTYTGMVILIACVLSAYLTYDIARQKLESQLSKELLGIVVSVSVALDVDQHEEIFFDPEFGLEGEDAFESIRQFLVSVANANHMDHFVGLSPIYTLRPSVDEEQLEFVVMTDHNESGSYFSGAKIQREDFHVHVLEGHQQTTGLYRDSEGVWVTAAAPIRDHDGTIVGLVQADRPLDFFVSELSEIRRQYVMGALIGIAIGLVLSILFSRRFIKPIGTLVDSTHHFSSGDYDYQITETRQDEFGTLFSSFNNMAASLSHALEELNLKNAELERRAVEYQSTALFALLNPGPVMRVNYEGFFIWSNSPAKEFFSRSMKHADEVFFRVVFKNLSLVEMQKIIDDDGKEIFVHRHEDNWYQFTVSGVKKFQFANVYGSNITERILAEQAADKARDEAEAANTAKSQFLATMSHELRTPMNAIIGYNRLAKRLDMKKKNYSDRIHDYLTRVETSSKSLLDLINNILDFSKVEADRVDIEKIDFDAKQLLNDIHDMFSRMAAEKKLDLIFYVANTVPDQWCGDSVRLKQVLVNLINNALKFTHTGTVALHVFPAPQNTLQFKVIDTGIGIAEDSLDKLFQPFIQADSTITRQYGGTGLGLSISQKLVGYMGGDLQVSSIVDEGSQFYFSLPLLAEASGSLPENALDDKYIDIVGDDTLFSKSVEMILNDAGAFTRQQTLAGYLEACEVNPSCVLDPELKQEISGFYHRGVVTQPLAASGSEAITADIIIFDVDESAEDLVAQWLQKNPEQGAKALCLSRSMDDEACRDERRVWLDKPIKQHALVDAIANRVIVNEAIVKGVAKGSVAPEGDCFPHAALAHESSVAVPKLNVAMAALEGVKVLIAEDDPVNQALDRELMAEINARYCVVDNGLEALENIQNNHYDIVLMDMQMPVMDGLSATRAIRALPVPDLPIIALTANALPSDVDNCLASGMDDYLPKPINQDDLFLTMYQWVKKTRGDMMPVYGVTEEGKRKNVVQSLCDFNLLLSLHQGDQQALNGMLQQFLQDYDERIAPALQSLDYQSLQQLGHWLNTADVCLAKQSLMQEIAALQANLELHEGVNGEVERDVTRLSVELEALVGGIKTHLEEQSPPEPLTASVPPSKDVSEKMKSLEAVIDFEGAIKRLGGRKKIYMNVLNSFYEKNSEKVDYVANALDAGDRDAAIREAHSITGISGTLGATDLQRSAKALELVLKKSDDSEELEAVLDAYNTQYRVFIQSVQGFLRG